VVATLIEYMDITINLLGHSPEGGEHAEYIIKKELDAFAAKRPNLEIFYPGITHNYRCQGDTMQIWPNQ